MAEPGYRGLPRAPRAAEEACTSVYSCRLGPTLESALRAAVERVERWESVLPLISVTADKASVVREALWRGLCDLATEDLEFQSDRARRGEREANATVRARYAR